MSFLVRILAIKDLFTERMRWKIIVNIGTTAILRFLLVSIEVGAVKETRSNCYTENYDVFTINSILMLQSV